MHSGDDLASAAERVLGFEKTSRKGKAVSVEPLPGVATPELRAALERLVKPAPSAEQARDGRRSDGGSPHSGHSATASEDGRGGAGGAATGPSGTADGSAGGSSSGGGRGSATEVLERELEALLVVRRRLSASWEAAPPQRLK